MNLVILTERDRRGEQSFLLDDFRAEHIRSILKLNAGDTVEVGLLNGPLATARIERVTVGEVTLSCEDWRAAPQADFETDLICALPRPQTLKKVLITCAMTGVRSLRLIRANRVEKSYFQSPLMQEENRLPYLIEGLAQGKLTRLPEVSIHDRFRNFFEDELTTLMPNDASTPFRLLAVPESEESLCHVLSAPIPVIVAIGPEGGWVPFETDLMQSLGFRPFTLGSWTLRVEHAVTAVLSQLELIRLMPRR